jgi:glutamine amidotransferase
MRLNIAIINYGMGNLHSVYKSLSDLNVRAFVAETETEIGEADKIILPGVGNFEKAISNLKKSGMHDALNEAVVVKERPVLGICLGMQLMAKSSEEGDSGGFGWVNARVCKLRVHNSIDFKIPQTGWNTVIKSKESRLMHGVCDTDEFYFLHSYHCEVENSEFIVARTLYETEFVSAIEQGNVYGTQFHPEKSHAAGMGLLKNFVAV